MSRKSRRTHKAKQKQKQRLLKRQTANLSITPNEVFNQESDNASISSAILRTVRDLPKYSKMALSLCFLLQFITKGKADDLHGSWNGVLFQTNDANAINFGLQLDPTTYPDVNAVTAQILQQCGNLIQVVQPNWWNDQSIDWQSLYSACDRGIYKTQAQAYMALSQYVLDQIEDIAVPDSVWQCMDTVLTPSCQTSFFTDWAGFYKAIGIMGLAVGVCCTAGITYGAVKYLQHIWSRRSGYDDIPERQSINPCTQDIEANGDHAAKSSMRVD
jgi:hypothetical protein